VKLITERDSIKSAIESFISTHGKGTYRADKRDIMVGEELAKLNKETCSAEDVNNLINSDWVSMRCHDCGNMVKTFVELGEEPDYESYTANICLDCLKKAVNLVEDTKE
jgi:hypothetical protein